MGSSQQFPSGLNKWIDSDKPIRADFVRDNEIIDQDAMWKSAYDSDGDVAALGGIPAYVGQQSQLTLDNAQTHTESYAQSVNQATAAISGNVLEITSDIARSGIFYDVQFVAPTAHSMAQQIVIDGDAVALTTLDGSELSDGAWQQDSVVTLTKKSDKAFLKTGGNNSRIYSLSETPTGEYWIDGRPLYQKVVQITRATATANNVVTNHNTGLSGVSYAWIEMSKLQEFDLPYMGSTLNSFIMVRLDETYANIIIRSFGTWNARSGYAIIKYTKIADPAL